MAKENIHNNQIKGKIHSFESFGTVDGPGIRFVVFMGGCPLRCQYCHNIDMVLGKVGDEYTPEDVVAKIERNKPYFEGSGGGVTFSGGEPTMQPDFLEATLKLCQEHGIHTTVDSSLFCAPQVLERIIPHTDLFMVSLKHFDNEMHKKLAGVPNKQILENVHFLSEKGVRLWLRFVLLPGVTDTEENVRELISLCKKIEFEKLELLPYHMMGVEKWKKLGIDYELKDIKPPSKEVVSALKKRLEQEGIKVAVSEG